MGEGLIIDSTIWMSTMSKVDCTFSDVLIDVGNAVFCIERQFFEAKMPDGVTLSEELDLKLSDELYHDQQVQQYYEEASLSKSSFLGLHDLRRVSIVFHTNYEF